MRIVITGAGGLLGGRLATLLAAEHQITGAVRTQPAPEGIHSATADLAQADDVRLLLDRTQPEAVIHCAALADAEICEQDPARAQRDNGTATLTLARACAVQGARLICVSTDLVFGGGAPFSDEVSPTEPVMEYGRSKLRAEAATFEAGRSAVIVRVALVQGRGFGPRRTASESIAHRLRQGAAVTLYEDEWRTPIDPESVASAVRAILARPEIGGVFHLGGPERLSRLELGRRVAVLLGLDVSLVRSRPQASHQGAPRPKDVSLDITKAGAELGWRPRPIEVAIREGR